MGGGGGCGVSIPSSGGRRVVGGFCVGGRGRAGSRRRSRLLGGRRGWRLWCSGLRSRSVLRSVSLSWGGVGLVERCGFGVVLCKEDCEGRDMDRAERRDIGDGMDLTLDHHQLQVCSW